MPPPGGTQTPDTARAWRKALPGVARDPVARSARERNADITPSRGSLLAGQRFLRFVRPAGATESHAGDGADQGLVTG